MNMNAAKIRAYMNIALNLCALGFATCCTAALVWPVGFYHIVAASFQILSLMITYKIQHILFLLILGKWKTYTQTPLQIPNVVFS